MDAHFQIEGKFGRFFAINADVFKSKDAHISKLRDVIEAMAEGSRVAQGIDNMLSSPAILVQNPAQKLYIVCNLNFCLGILKVGSKRLFVSSGSGGLREILPLCVLDFYVHESQQRRGIGLALFNFMLKCEKCEPRKLAYDRPSAKLLPFLARHFGLSKFEPQNNKFVVFDSYFDSKDAGRQAAGQGGNGAQWNREKRPIAGQRPRCWPHDQEGQNVLLPHLQQMMAK